MEEIKSVNEVETKKEEEKIAWYAVSTMPGRERKVKESLESRAVTMGQSDVFHKVILVEQPEIEIKRNKPVEVMRNLFPGYLFVEVEMTDELWYVIRNTPGVTGFIGSSGKGAKPIPVRDADMLNVLALAGEKSEAMPEVKYNVGDIVKILTGPFVNNEGKITSINGDKVNVEIIFFGRSTDVEIEVTNIAAVK